MEVLQMLLKKQHEPHKVKEEFIVLEWVLKEEAIAMDIPKKDHLFWSQTCNVVLSTVVRLYSIAWLLL